MEFVITLFDYEDRRVVTGWKVPSGAVGRKVIVTTCDFEDCDFEYTGLLKVNSELSWLVAKQTTGPPQRFDAFHRQVRTVEYGKNPSHAP